MMELSGVILIVLALISCVACTPYGYGVKGGAAAKADANAASNAFGGALPAAIPLSISSGGGFSGSFSKSSSSSFASSSASASSSSSSFSIGGTGVNGVAGNNIPSSLYGLHSAHNGFGASGSIAQAAAGASAVAGSSALSHNVGGLPCAGNNCNTAGNSNECTSNECGSSGHQHNLNDNKNCLSGHCPPSPGIPNGYGSDLQKENSPSIQQQTDLNDFEVYIGGKSKSSNNLSHGHTSGFDANGSQNSCAYGKCGITTNAASALSTDHNEPSTKNCNSPDSGCHTNPQQPATHLTTPNIEPACSTHNCNSALTGSNLNNGKPSSYNVPILGGNSDKASSNYNSHIPPTGPLYNLPSGAPPKSVITPKIPSYSDGIYSSPLPAKPSGSPGCIGLNCDSLNNPSYQSLGSPSCNTPNCGVSPITSVPSSQNGFIKPGSVPASTQSVSFGVAGTENNSGHNEYSGHSDGFLKPNPDHSTSNAGSLNVVAHPGPSEIPKTNILSTSQNTQGYTGGFGAPTASIDAGNRPNTGSGASAAFAHGLNNGLKPGSSEPSSQSIPSYTGGFGGSAGSFDTNTGSKYQSKPTHENPSSASNAVPYNTGILPGPGHASLGLPKPDSSLHLGHSSPSYTGGFGRPTGSADVHSEVGSHDKPHIVGGASVTGLHGSFGIKPESVAVPLSQKNPSYTGGFGGSAGSFDTNTGSYYQSKPTHENPSSASNDVPTNTGILAGPGHASLGLPKPDSSLHLGHSLPSYTGGFGTPTESADVHSQVGSHEKPHIVGGAPVTGLHGSFGIKPESVAVPLNQKNPAYTGGFGGSAGSFDTNTGSYYQSKPTHENPSSASNAVPHNTGILAGPGHASLGLPKPDSSLHLGHSSPSYASGFRGPTGSADVHSEVGSHDKPQIVGGAPVTGLHGSFGIKPESVAVPLDQKNPSYTGGFGGSPGTFDTGSKIGTHVKTNPTHDEVSSGPHIAQTSGEHTGSGATAISGTGSSNHHDIHKLSESLIPPNTGLSNTGYIAGANNALQPGLAKPDGDKTKLPPYSGGFGGPSGVLRPNEYSVSTNSPTSPLGHASCTTGNCGSVNLPSGKEHSLSSDASAVANAKAVAYSGSFGGSPGFLKPFDEGKPSNNGHDEHTGKIITGHEKPASGVNTEYGNTPSVLNKTPSNSVNAANAGATANAASFASSNAYSANQGISSSGCNSGCGSNYSGNDGSYASSLNSSKTGALEGHDSPVGSLASANSVAGAGAGSFGTGRSFASSSASAHASTGAAVKGGYGRR